ncbi:MAG: hypothetical protein ACP5QR_07320 [Rhizomicrobium sp.]
MKPSSSELLMVLLQDLSLRIAPALADTYLQSSAQLWAVLCLLTNQEQARAADVRLKDIRSMRAMFGSLSELVGPELKARLRAAHAGEDHHLDIASLDATHGELSTLLITLQEDLEMRADKTAREACKVIWSHLNASAQRHALTLPFS